MYVGLVAVGVQEQAGDIHVFVPPLLRNCLTLDDISFSYSHYLPPQNSGPCNSFYCLGHFKNVYDDDDDDLQYVATLPCNSSLMACFADINISQDSAATYARCGGIFNIHLTTNLLWNLPA